MTNLREQLAKRLAGLQWHGIGDDGNAVADMEIDAAQGPGTTWGDLADECLRQMEWVREPFISIQRADESGKPLMHTQGQGMDGFTKLANFTAAAKKPLTLAPEDWQP